MRQELEIIFQAAIMSHTSTVFELCWAIEDGDKLSSNFAAVGENLVKPHDPGRLNEILRIMSIYQKL
jgi:hypothetical protein